MLPMVEWWIRLEPAAPPGPCCDTWTCSSSKYHILVQYSAIFISSTRLIVSGAELAFLRLEVNNFRLKEKTPGWLLPTLWISCLQQTVVALTLIHPTDFASCFFPNEDLISHLLSQNQTLIIFSESFPAVRFSLGIQLSTFSWFYICLFISEQPCLCPQHTQVTPASPWQRVMFGMEWNSVYQRLSKLCISIKSKLTDQKPNIIIK